MIKRNLGYGFFGNGMVVWDSLHEEHGDYQKVAWISPAREVEYYAELGPEDKEAIETFAAEGTPSMSVTQTWKKVFHQKPPREKGKH